MNEQFLPRSVANETASCNVEQIFELLGPELSAAPLPVRSLVSVLAEELQGKELIYVDITLPRQVQAESWNRRIAAIMVALGWLALLPPGAGLLSALTVTALAPMLVDFICGGPTIWAITDKTLIRIRKRTIKRIALEDVQQLDARLRDSRVTLWYQQSFPGCWIHIYPRVPDRMLEELIIHTSEARREAKLGLVHIIR